MRTTLAVLIVLAVAPVPARAQEAPDGVWLVAHQAAVRLFDCSGALCGSVVWLRNPALRTAALCNKSIIWGLQPAGIWGLQPAGIWGLQPAGTGQWSGGSFFDPENGTAYHVDATQESPDEISADVYPAVSWLGETVSLLRIAPYSLNGWCG